VDLRGRGQHGASCVSLGPAQWLELSGLIVPLQGPEVSQKDLLALQHLLTSQKFWAHLAAWQPWLGLSCGSCEDKPVPLCPLLLVGLLALRGSYSWGPLDRVWGHLRLSLLGSSWHGVDGGRGTAGTCRAQDTQNDLALHPCCRGLEICLEAFEFALSALGT
jgi:hypothetical protein